MSIRPDLPEFTDATHVRLGRRRLLFFGGSNYLGLSRHPAILAAMRRALRGAWIQPGASRRTTGDHPRYRKAESALARFFRVGDAALLPCGYLAPLAAAGSLRDRVTHVFLDDRAHACVADAMRLMRRPVTIFRGGDLEALRARLERLPKGARPLIGTEGVFGIRGGLPPLDSYLACLPRDGWLLVDDAHGAGGIGPGGRGAVAMFGLQDSRIVQTVSLAKAFGVGGGAVLGTRSVIEAVRRDAGPFVGTTSMPFTVVAGVHAALGVVAKSPGRLRRLRENAHLLYGLLPHVPEMAGDPRTPVFAMFPRSRKQAGRLRRALVCAGIFPPLIRYLGGPPSGFFRFAVCSEHRPAEVRLLASVLSEALDS